MKCFSSKDHEMHCFVNKHRIFFLVYLIVNLLTKLYFLRRCECNHKPIEFDLKEAVEETRQIVNETQRMVKALYDAHLEENDSEESSYSVESREIPDIPIRRDGDEYYDEDHNIHGNYWDES